MTLAGLRAKPLILLVDDDAMERFLLRQALEPAGLDIVEANSGAVGLAAFSEARPDLVVLDVVMPDMNGFEVCRAIRAAVAGADTPILMATGLDDVTSIERAYRAGATDFIGKPINWPVLPHRIRYMLRAYEVEHALRAARDEAESASAAKTAFLAAMSHELRTPLNAIIGFSELILSSAFGPVSPAKYGELAEYIREAGQRTLAAFTDVLTMAQLEAGRWELSLAETDLRAVVKAAVDEFGVSGPGRDRDIRFRSAAEQATVRADERAVREILLKLLSNAAKFSGPETPIQVAVDRAETGKFRVVVADSGIGMTAEESQAAMRPFHQVDARLARRYEGLGLGLSIAGKLVECQGGELMIDSAPRRGTRICLDFPALLEEPPELATTPPLAAAAAC